MYIDTFSILALSTLMIGYLIRVIIIKKAAKQREADIRRLARTVQKLRKKNGKLWYEIFNEAQRQTPNEQTEVTITEQINLDPKRLHS